MTVYVAYFVSVKAVSRPRTPTQVISVILVDEISSQVDI